MHILRVLVLSDIPLLVEIIKQKIEKIASTKVTFAVNGKVRVELMSNHTYDFIIAVCKNLKVIDLNEFFRHLDHPAEIVVIGWNEEQMVVYSRSVLKRATLRNITKVLNNIREQHLSRKIGN